VRTCGVDTGAHNWINTEVRNRDRIEGELMLLPFCEYSVERRGVGCLAKGNCTEKRGQFMHSCTRTDTDTMSNKSETKNDLSV
jgi:hypothetical protein